MRRRSSRVLLLILACLTVAACGTTTRTRTVTRTVTRTATTTATPRAVTEICSPADATMNCVLQGVPAPPPRFGVTRGQAWGLDFGWSGVSASLAKAQGAAFGASYLSPDLSKNWTAALVNAYHAAGLKTVAVWESTAARATEGYSAGVADANAAKAQAAALGNTNRPLDFAVDCDCTGASILGYFKGVHSVLGSRDDAYGGYDQISYLHQHAVVGNANWQTYAWSGGRWLPASVAPLEQYLNGAVFDHDKAIAADYGQWPYAKPRPRPAVLPQCYTHRENRAACNAAQAKVARDEKAVVASERVYVGRRCPMLAQRVSWFSKHLRRYPHVKRARRRQALAASRRAYRRLSCRVFAQRVRYFTRAGAAVKAAN